MIRFSFWQLVILMIFFSNFPVFAGYKTNISKGNEAYKRGNYYEALIYYNEAYKEKPNPQILNFINKLKYKINENKIVTQNLESKVLTSSTDKSYWLWVLVGFDAALSGMAAWSIISANNSIKSYNDLHSRIDNTNQENLETLKQQYKIIEYNKTFAIIATSVAGAAVLYTIADAFWLHHVFPKTDNKVVTAGNMFSKTDNNVGFMINPSTNEILFSYNIKY